MSNITNEKFIEFIESYMSNDKYFDSITEISRSKTYPKQPLIRNDFKMISLDDVCQNSNVFGYNFPKTTDALWYKNENNEFTLYIIEFKFYNLDNAVNHNTVRLLKEVAERKNKEYFEDHFSAKPLFSDRFFKDFNKVERYFENKVDFSLKMKPVETLIEVLPNLYKEYCGFDDERDAEDCREFLRNIDKKFYVFLMKGSTFDLKAHDDYIKKKLEDEKKSKSKKRVNRSRGRFNKSKNRVSANASKLHLQFLRYKHAEIFDDYKILAGDQFSSFLKEEGLKQE